MKKVYSVHPGINEKGIFYYIQVDCYFLRGHISKKLKKEGSTIHFKTRSLAICYIKNIYSVAIIKSAYL